MVGSFKYVPKIQKAILYIQYNQGTLGSLGYVNFTIAILSNAIKFFDKA